MSKSRTIGAVRYTIIVVDTEQHQERRREFDKSEVTLGRTEDNDIVLAAGTVSRRHARVIEQDGRVFIVDLKTANGTWLNRKQIQVPAVFRPEDRVSIGKFELRIEYERVAPTPEANPYRAPAVAAVNVPAVSLTSGASGAAELISWSVRWSDASGPHRVTSSVRVARIGSDSACEVCVRDPLVPSVSARIEQREGFVFVIPMSTTPATLHGRPLLVPTLWNLGETLTLGTTQLTRAEP